MITGQLVKTTDAYGYSTIVEYNSIGKTAIIDLEKERNVNMMFGNLVQVIYPDGTTEEYTYDKEGLHQPTGSNTTHYLYDKLGRLIKTTYLTVPLKKRSMTPTDR